MKVAIVALFPEYFSSPFKYAPLRKALEKNILKIKFFSPIDYSEGPKDVEGYQYGGGEGMVIKVEYTVRAIEEAKKWIPEAPVFLLSPSGKLINQDDIKSLSKLPGIILVGGHYKGIDSRIYNFVDVEISIGNYIVSSGELAILVLIDSITRLLEGVLTHRKSAETDSLHSELIEPPIYTWPYDFSGMKVPKILLSGNHRDIALWRKEQSLKRTLLFKPDLLLKAKLDGKDLDILGKIYREISEVIKGALKT